MAKELGRALVAQLDSTKLGNVTSISLNVDGEVVNVSDWDSGDWNDKLAGRKDWQMTIGVYYNAEDAGQGDAETMMFSTGRSGTLSFGPETPASGDVVYSGTVIMSNFNPDASGADDAITANYTFEGNGALTRTVTA